MTGTLPQIANSRNGSPDQGASQFFDGSDKGWSQLEWMRLRKVLRQNGFGRIEGVPAVVRRDSSKDMVTNRLRKIAKSNCRF
jgi:hypothetical protein